MPNHVRTTLDIYEGCEAFKKYLVNEEVLDFNLVIPMPEELNIESGSATDYGMYIIKHNEGDKSAFDSIKWFPWLNDCKTNKEVAEKLKDRADLIAGKKALNNLKKYGHKSWYGWCREHWGTKWNAYGCEVLEYPFDERMKYYFETAWDIPIPILNKIAEDNPNLYVEGTAIDEGENFRCFITLKNGKLKLTYRE